MADSGGQCADHPADRAEHALSRRVPQPPEQGTRPPDADRSYRDRPGDSRRGARGPRVDSRHYLQVHRKPNAAVRAGRPPDRRQLAPYRPDLPAQGPERAELDQGCCPGPRPRVQRPGRREIARRVRRAAGRSARGLARSGSRQERREGRDRGPQRARHDAGHFRRRPDRAAACCSRPTTIAHSRARSAASAASSPARWRC